MPGARAIVVRALFLAACRSDRVCPTRGGRCKGGLRARRALVSVLVLLAGMAIGTACRQAEDPPTAVVVVTPRVLVGPLQACGDPLPGAPADDTCLVAVPLETRLDERAGVGARVLSIRSTVRNTGGPTHVTVQPWTTTGADLVRLKGTDRIPARGSLTVPQSLSFIAQRPAPGTPRSYHVTVAVWTFDDHAVSMEWNGEIRVPHPSAP